MDVASLAAAVMGMQNQAAMQDAQIVVFKKAVDQQGAAAMQLLNSMSMPLATEGSVGTNLNVYA